MVCCFKIFVYTTKNKVDPVSLHDKTALLRQKECEHMTITHLSQLFIQPVSHDPHLSKQVMIANGVVPHVTNFSQAVIPPNETVTTHHHQDMWEVFLVSEGEGSITINGTEHTLTKGTCVVVEPGEEHSLVNTGKSALVLTYFGVA